MSGRHVTGSGTNSQGNTYTNYSDGSYRYSNNLSNGGHSHYYQNSSGGGFYNNPSKGYSSYTRPDGSGWRKQTF